MSHGIPLKTILYVDEEQDICTVTKMVLNLMGQLEVVTCCSSAEALAVAAGIEPDLIMLDINMPDMDGTAMLQALRELPHIADIPAILMSTSYANPSQIAHYRALGAIGIISKPFDPMQLTHQVQKLWQMSVPASEYVAAC
jgi:two-component system OmpR family response regulator